MRAKMHRCTVKICKRCIYIHWYAYKRLRPLPPTLGWGGLGLIQSTARVSQVWWRFLWVDVAGLISVWLLVMAQAELVNMLFSGIEGWAEFLYSSELLIHRWCLVFPSSCRWSHWSPIATCGTWSWLEFQQRNPPCNFPYRMGGLKATTNGFL